MFGFLTSRWQSGSASEKMARPVWFDRHVTPVLLSIAKKACTHPIHTIVTIAFLASYSYLGILDKGLLETGTVQVAGKVDFTTLLTGSQRLRISEETGWRWEAEEPTEYGKVGGVCKTYSMERFVLIITQSSQEFALVTLVFPESSDINSLEQLHNVSAKLLPSSSNSFSTISPDTSLAFSVPFAEAPEFLTAMQEIAAGVEDSSARDSEGKQEEKKWIMKAAKSGNSPTGVRNWIRESWTSFVDLLKVGQSVQSKLF